ncbi:RHS repeat-associated core domain-containing protein [Leptospira tipperaryensis]|uniref:RHS repeat-associated core domain-containing protein n=1 Tax=Leptospira tipperaryensis TaxID=2564040 RepID=UPI0009F2F3A0|nr:RHS repeat-associated core domain-containing protein [Leptospira tipperaryensis]
MKFNLQTINRKFIVRCSLLLLIAFSSIASFPLLLMFSSSGPSPETEIPQPLPEVEVDSFGNANLSISIPFPKGTKNLTPSISLEYNSLQNEGLVGGGWDLSGIMTISLNPSKGIHNDGSDSYISFAGDLVQTSPGIFHSKLESFFQFKKFADTWTAQDRNGVTYFFGEDTSTENPNSNATIRNLSGKSRIWSLNRVQDLQGNGYIIKYQPYSSVNGTPIPERISYNQGNTVILFEDEDRSDAVESNFLNIQAKLTKRLKTITVNQRQDDGSIAEAEKYTLNYNSNSFDKKDRLVGLDRKNYAPLTFNYNNLLNSSSTSTSKSSPSAIDMSYRFENTSLKPDCDFAALVCACSANPTCMAVSGGFAGLACAGYVNSIGDMCTNGIVGSQTFLATFDPGKPPEPVWISGIIKENRLVRYDSSNPGLVTPVATKKFNLNEKSKVLQGDIDGDLATDFVVLENDNTKASLRLSLSDGEFALSDIVVNLPTNPNAFQGLVDLNADGKSDLIQTDASNNFLIYLAVGGSLSTNPITLSIPGIGSSFRQFVDMDGNGIADFVRLSDNPDGSKNLNISYLSFSSGVFSVRANSSVHIGIPGNEGDRFLADSNGDGYLDLITYSIDTLYVYLSDGHTLQSPLSFPVSYATPYIEASSSGANGKRYSMRDINWDGVLDRISLINNGFQIDLFNPNTGSFDSSFQVSNDGSQVAQFDINWDGNIDSISFYTFFFNGTGFHVKNGTDDSNTDVVFDYSETVPVPPNPALLAADRDAMYSNFVNTKTFADADGDGKADFIRFSNGKIYISYSRSKNNSLFYSNGGDSSFSSPSFSMAVDTNQDGRIDFIGFRATIRDLVVPTLWNNLPTFERNTFAHSNAMNIDFIEPVYSNKISHGLLTDVLGTQEKGIQISYANTFDVSNPSVTNAVNINSVGAFLKPNLSPYSVATNVYTQVANGLGESELYVYEDSRIYVKDQDNRSMMGFAKVTSAETLSGKKNVCFYQGTNPNFVGIETGKDEYLNNRLMSSTVSTFTSLTSSFGTVNVRKTQDVSTQYQNGILLSSSQTNYTYDLYNNILSKVTQIDSDPSLTLREDAIYNSSLSDWVLSEVIQQSKSQGGVLSSQLEFSYSNHLLSDKKTLVKAGTTQYSIQSFLAYDSFGNPTSIRDPNGNLSTLEYDLVTNSYVTKVVNSLGHQTNKTYDYVFGKELTLTDENGNTSQKLYDFYGREIGTKYPGETNWSEVVDYIQTGSPSGEKVKKTIYDPKTGDTYTQETNDAFGRTVKTERLVADAIVFTQDTAYNSNGTIISKNEPYPGTVPFITTNYTYDIENKVIKVSDTSGKISDISYSAFNVTTLTSVSGTLVETLLETKNQLGQLVLKTKNGKSIGYSYNSQGIANKITDPEGKNIIFSYDLMGNKFSQTTPDTGTTTFVNSPTGKVLQQTNANGYSTVYQYDNIDRLIRITGTHSSGATQNVQLTYDEPASINGKGRLTSVIDMIGKVEFQYDARGNQNKIKKTLNQEDLSLIFLKDYDFGNRPTAITYPDGTVIHNQYTVGGYLTSVTMDTADGSSAGHSVVNYTGPLVENGKYKVLRGVGNGVQTSIYFDPIFRRPTEIISAFDTDVYESLKYEYDLAQNITKIEDLRNPSRTQIFQYDQFNRVTNSAGKYGSEDYQYSDAGNLIKKGGNIYSYNGSNVHAVTRITSPQGTQLYSYDSSGLMTNRDGDTLEYNPMGKLQRILTKDGEVMTFDYDYKGSRIRKSKQSDASSVVSIDGLYEISFRPGFTPIHTVYIKGLEDEIVSQIGLQNVNLLTDAHFSSKETEIASAVMSPKESICKGIAIDCFQYYKNRFLNEKNMPTALSWIFDIRDGKIGNRFRLGVMALFGICVISFVGMVLYGTPTFKNLKPTQAGVTPVLILSVFMSFNFFSCGLLPGTGNKNGDPPWIALPSTIPVDTPSVSNPGVGGGSNPGGSPVPGMIFFHPNHLGSITMATNGAGKPISGGSATGTSFVSYKPYGEILRTDSYGPDAFRYKYAGQEEDKETGLLFYKSRYYDPTVGRFLQSDSVVDTESLVGSNLFMFVDGNPLQYNDPTGNNAWIHMFNRIIGHMLGKDFGSKNIDKKLSTSGISKGLSGGMFGSNSFFRHFENKKLGQLVGSGKAKNWIKENINSSKVSAIFAKSLGCSNTTYNPLCSTFEKMLGPRDACVKAREVGKDARDKIGNGMTIIGAYAGILGYELLGAFLIMIDVGTLINATMRCRGDSGPML